MPSTQSANKTGGCFSRAVRTSRWPSGAKSTVSAILTCPLNVAMLRPVRKSCREQTCQMEQRSLSDHQHAIAAMHNTTKEAAHSTRAQNKHRVHTIRIVSRIINETKTAIGHVQMPLRSHIHSTRHHTTSHRTRHVTHPHAAQPVQPRRGHQPAIALPRHTVHRPHMPLQHAKTACQSQHQKSNEQPAKRRMRFNWQC